MKNRTGLKLIVLLLPFILGFIGFKLGRNGYSYLDAAYASFQMYFASIPTDWDHNIYIEIGRWMAPFCAIFFGIGIIIELIGGAIWPRFWAKLPSHYVVYGDNAWTNPLCGGNGNPFFKYYVLNAKTFVNCSKYVLLFDSDQKNLDFYTGFLLPKLKNKNVKVYMNVMELEPQDIHEKRLIPFQINNFIAVSFFKNPEWIDYEKTLIDKKKGNVIKIAIIGFSDLGKRLLQNALVMNIISETQKIEYHIWGDVNLYLKKHTGLSDRNLKPDKVIFHKEDVNGFLQFLENFDVVFLCGTQEENLLILSDLLRLTAFVGKGGRIYSYVENEEILNLFQVTHIGVKQERQKTEKSFLLNDRLFPISVPDKEHFLDKVISNNLSIFKRAEEKHKQYIDSASKKEQDKESPKYKYFEWNELNSYLRWENISSANYDDIKNLLRQKGVQEEQLAAFEHMRWLRSHYLDNWEYAEQRDDSIHRHPDLTDFVFLSNEEKDKDKNWIKPVPECVLDEKGQPLL